MNRTWMVGVLLVAAPVWALPMPGFPTGAVVQTFCGSNTRGQGTGNLAKVCYAETNRKNGPHYLVAYERGKSPIKYKIVGSQWAGGIEGSDGYGYGAKLTVTDGTKVSEVLGLYLIDPTDADENGGPYPTWIKLSGKLPNGLKVDVRTMLPGTLDAVRSGSTGRRSQR